MAVWYFNGVSSETLRVVSAQIVNQAMGENMCRIVMLADLNAPPVWGLRQTVVVTCGSRVSFVGQCMEPVRSGGARSETITYTLQGPWWRLQENQFLQPDPTLSNQASTDASANRMLFTDAQGNAQSTRATLAEVMASAARRGLISSYSGVDELREGVYPTPELAVTRSYADVITSILRFHPDITLSAFYGSIRFGRLGSLGGRSCRVGIGPLESVSLQRRGELAPNGVVIRYTLKGASQTASGFRGVYYKDAYPSGTASDGEGVITEEIMLDSEETITPGLAQVYYDMFRPAPYEGQLTFVDDECQLSVFPGSTVTVYGMYGTPQVLVQSVEEDLNSGRTTLSCGTPPMMDLQTMVDVLRGKRRGNRDVGLSERPFENITEPTTALTTWMDIVERVPVLRMTPGIVRDGIHDHVPTWEGNTPLDAANKPYSEILKGADYSVWLRLRFTPEVMAFDVYGQDGSSTKLFRPVGVGAVKDLRVVFNVPDDYVEPTIDPLRGDVTDAICYFKMARVIWPIADALPTISVVRRGNLEVHYVPPGRIYLVVANEAQEA